MKNTTSKKNGITREQLIEWATRHGWTLDRWGHLKKMGPKGSPHRLKLSRVAVRHEVEVAGGWFRLTSGYYKNLTITADDKLAGLTR